MKKLIEKKIIIRNCPRVFPGYAAKASVHLDKVTDKSIIVRIAWLTQGTDDSHYEDFLFAIPLQFVRNVRELKEEIRREIRMRLKLFGTLTAPDEL